MSMLRDLLPTPPWKGPPLPGFLTKNPGTWKAWTSPEEYFHVAEKAGDWATARSASMLSKADIMAGKLDNMADKMYSKMMLRLSMVPTPPELVPTAPAKVRKPRAKKVTEEVIPEVKEAIVALKEAAVVTPKLRKAKPVDVEELTRLASSWRREEKKFPSLSEIEEVAKSRGLILSDSQINKVVKTLKGEAPIKIEEIKPGIMEWIKVVGKHEKWPDSEKTYDYARMEYHGYLLSDEIIDKWLKEAKG